MSFYNTISKIEHVISTIPWIRRLPSLSRSRLSVDIAFVGSSLRTGCLIDLFTPKEPVVAFTRLLEVLIGNDWTRNIVLDVSHVFEPSSGQSFLVNRKLLRQRLSGIPRKRSQDGNVQQPPMTNTLIGELTFVTLFPGSGCKISSDSEIPPELYSAIDSLLGIINSDATPLRGSITLPDNLPLSAAVALAAVILDYPVAYVPSVEAASSSPIFLSGVAVKTYECVLAYAGPDPPTPTSIMKFSAPAVLEEEQPDTLSPRKTTKHLEELFRARLESIGDGSAQMTVICETVTFDRLAL
ncbi:hypothetical protein DFP72DRAFT_845846 [Ephemerocybe angulata]|uniref:Uncharacterized protein n=1 Tax=Ephemerocybe angulata TaxID=980116 RepID=A0A8H6I3U5_9AGAR|nr:hypothetical protein DFP72DRAFT_845846 [Tulosesus angulatus]